MVGAVRLAGALAPNYRLAIGTNGMVPMQRAKLDAARLGTNFAYIAFSEELGVEKPQPAFFNRVLDAMRCTAASAVMVGDHPINDIAGASAVGMKTCWLRSAHFSPPPAADACIDSLDLLPCP